MKVTVMIVIGALDTVTKGSVQGLGRIVNKRTSGDHPKRSARILRRVLVT